MGLVVGAPTPALCGTTAAGSIQVGSFQSSGLCWAHSVHVALCSLMAPISPGLEVMARGACLTLQNLLLFSVITPGFHNVNLKGPLC